MKDGSFSIDFQNNKETGYHSESKKGQTGKPSAGRKLPRKKRIHVTHIEAEWKDRTFSRSGNYFFNSAALQKTKKKSPSERRSHAMDSTQSLHT